MEVSARRNSAVIADFSKRKTAPAGTFAGIFDDDVCTQVTAARPVATTSPITLEMTKTPSAQSPGAKVGQRRSMVVSTPVVGTTTIQPSQPSQPSQLTIPLAARTASSSMSSTGATPIATGRNRRLSFDVPQTPESSWYCQPTTNYTFGTLGTRTETISPITEMAEPLVTTLAPTTVAAAPVTVTPAKVISSQPAGPAVTVGSTAPSGVSGVTTNASTLMPGTYTGMYPGMPGMYPGMPGMPVMPGMPGMPMPMPMPGPGGVAYMPVPVPVPVYSGPAEAASTYLPTYPAGGEGMRLELGSLLPQAVPVASGLAEPVTTVMLRNIPLKYNRESLLADLDARGFMYTYDFFYLPIDFHTGNNVGYAFINFIDEATVARFRGAYNGLQLSSDSAKICEVSEAKAQGKMKNVDQYRNSSVMSMEDRYQPVVFENGVRQQFPPPTRSLKPVKPRVRAA